MSAGILSFFIYFVFLSSYVEAKSDNYERDPQGYLVYCPCMGKVFKTNNAILSFH